MKNKWSFFAILPLIVLPLASCQSDSNWVKGEVVTSENLKDNKFTLKEFKDVVFEFHQFKGPSLVTSDGYVIFDSTIRNLFLTDVNKDGYRDFCATLSIGSGFINEAVVIYDYKNKKEIFNLDERFQFDYRFSLDKDSYLIVEKYNYQNINELIQTGHITFSKNTVLLEWVFKNYLTSGIEYELYLYNNKNFEPPKCEVINNKKKYIVNNFSTFALKLKSQNGHGEELFENSLYEVGYVNYSLDENSFKDKDGSKVYLIQFRRSRDVEVKLKIMNFAITFDCVIDNLDNSWDKFKSPMKDTFKWMNEIDSTNLTEVSLEPKPGSIAPGSFYEIYYSKDKSVIEKFLKVKDFKIYETHHELASGDGPTIYRFYNDKTEYELYKISDAYRYETKWYGSMDYIDRNLIMSRGEKYNKILTYADNIEVYKLNDPTNKFKIDYLDDIEFIECIDEEITAKTEPIYVIDDFRATSEPIEIYSETLFSAVRFEDRKFYKITSDINFSSLF